MNPFKLFSAASSHARRLGHLCPSQYPQRGHRTSVNPRSHLRYRKIGKHIWAQNIEKTSRVYKDLRSSPAHRLQRETGQHIVSQCNIVIAIDVSFPGQAVVYIKACFPAVTESKKL